MDAILAEDEGIEPLTIFQVTTAFETAWGANPGILLIQK